ncbi:hypothetical protein [Aureispira sp. CCB-E]|uniref:hypothetical protein n=1 Tax=Aureispira sp. CCB-E TaxID=3051121 RepID=UPI002868DDCB|nr:hypothetical protein [Aureispira sp. CCB-E]WMX13247.1 hypothetical protein QP953_20595 [Aureispira sp. CCB-E]
MTEAGEQKKMQSISEENISILALKRELDELKQFVKNLVEHNEKDTILTTKEAAKILGLKPRTLRMYNDTMKLCGFRYTKNGPLFFKRALVVKYRDENLHHAAYFKD